MINSTITKGMIIPLLLISIGTACSDQRKIADNKTISVELEEIQDIELYRPTAIESVGSQLILIDEVKNRYLHLFNPVTKEKRTLDFSIGRGPGELLGPFSIHSRGDGEFWIHDLVLSKFWRFYYEKDSINIGSVISLKKSRILFPAFINDTTILGISILDSSKGWIIETSSNGVLYRKVVDFLPKSNSLPDNVYTESFQGVLKIKPDGLQFVVACRYTDILNIYTKEGVLISTHRSPEPFEPIVMPVIVNGNDVMGQSDETKLAYTGLAVTQDEIFALYSGKSRDSKNPSLSDKVLCFDWNGNLTKTLELPYEALGLCYHVDNGSLYFIILQNNKFLLAKL